jgi:PAS domain S-box-containing protein
MDRTTVKEREAGNPYPADPLDLIGEISRRVSQVSEASLGEVIGWILAGAKAVIGLQRGSAFLLDFGFDELHLLEVDEGALRPPIRRKVSSGFDSDSPRRNGPRVKAEKASLLKGGVLVSDVAVFAGDKRLGELCIVSTLGAIALEADQEELLASLASLAAVALDQCLRQRESLQRHTWLDAFSEIFAASRIPSSASEVEPLLKAIADNARTLSEADFVVLYEFFQERDDVRLPPTFAGPVLQEKVLRNRGVVAKHKRSAIFRLLEQQQPFYAEEAVKDWRSAGLLEAGDEQSFFAREKVVSSAGIPLRIEKEPVGVLFVNYRREFVFPTDFQKHLERFANQAALAIGNARFFLRSKRYSQDLEVVNRIGREFGSAATLDIKQIGRLIYEKTKEVISTENLFLCIYDSERDQYSLPFLRDKFDPRETLEPNLHQGLTGHVCRTRRPLIATADQIEGLIADGNAELVGKKAAIWLGAPLVVRDKVIGALVVQDYEDETKFNQEHLTLLESIASQAAIAIDNYWLLHDANLRVKELSALLELSQAFGTPRQNAMLSSTLDHLCELCGCNGSLLLLVDPGKRNQLKVRAASKDLQEYIDKTILLDEGVSGKVARSREPLFINGYSTWSERCHLFDPPPKRVCAVPLVWQEQVVGVITISSDSETGEFSPREIEILERFAGPVVIAVQNARVSAFRDALIHGGPDAIIAVDNKGRITEFNEEASKLFSFPSRQELFGRHVSELYWDGVEEARRIQSLLFEKQKIKEEGIFCRGATGTKLSVVLAAALLRDENGEPMGSVGILHEMGLREKNPAPPPAHEER